MATLTPADQHFRPGLTFGLVNHAKRPFSEFRKGPLTCASGGGGGI